MKKCTICLLVVMLFMLPSLFAYSQVKLHELPKKNVCLMKDYEAPVLKSINSIFTEDFSSGTYPPAGRTIVGDGQENWFEETSNNAGESLELCVPEYTSGCSLGDGFTDFALEEIENYGSGCDDLNGVGWSQYLSLGPAALTAGGTHNITMSSGYTGNFASIWIDFNDDFILTADERVLENYWIELAGQLYTVEIEIPEDAPAGQHIMRARTNFANFCDDPCLQYNYGEAEDYMIEIGGGGGPTIAFFDDFEDGLDNWEVTGAWGITDEYAYSPSFSLTDSPGGNYLANQETYATMTAGVDLSDPTILSADVDWWMIMDIENGNFDYLYVEVSTDNFATYTEIASFFGEGMLDPWMQYTYPLGAFLGNDNVKVRFHFSSDGGYEVDGCYIDDFSILTSDVDDAAPEIFFDKPFAYEGALEEYIVEAEIIDASGVASAEVAYSVDGVAQDDVMGVNTGGNMWEFTIPQQDPGYQVDFAITATDASTSSNMTTTDTASYIAGNYIGYDNAVVDFYTEIGPDGTGGLAGVAVVFTIDDPSQIVTALIRNYTDQSVGPNDEMIVHIWSDGGNGPGDDLIDPITIMPEANLVNTRAFTRVDLRPYAAQLSGLLGDVFVGFTVPTGVVRTTISQPGIASRSFNSVDGVTWSSIGDDYHFRIVTGEAGVNPIPPPTDLTAEPVDGDIVLSWIAPGGSKSAKDLLGYNVYYKFNTGSFNLLAEDIAETTYTDIDAAIEGLHAYYVTAVYDEGESIGSNEATVLIDGIEDQAANNTHLYPNPASNIVNLKSGFEIEYICVYSHSGQIVTDQKVNNTMFRLNTSEFKPGLYFFQIETTEGIITKRLIIQ